MTPLTPAGQALDPIAEAADKVTTRAGLSLLSTYSILAPAIAAIERQAADRALAELRREVEAEGPSTALNEGYRVGWQAGLDLFLDFIDKASNREEEA